MQSEPWRINLLGCLCAQQEQRTVTRFRTRKTCALLAYLAYHLNTSHQRERLAEMLWPECEPDAGRSSLRTALASLRRQFESSTLPAGSVLIADRAEVRLNVAVVTTGVAEFETAIDVASQTANADDQISAFVQGIELYRGELLPGSYEEWVRAERERLAARFCGALRQLTVLLEQSGQFERAIDYAYRAAAADPLCEEAHGDLIRLLVNVGRHSFAARQYQELERLLREEMGVTPSNAIRSLVMQSPSRVGVFAVARGARH